MSKHLLSIHLSCIIFIGLLLLTSCNRGSKHGKSILITDITQVEGVVEALAPLPASQKFSCYDWEHYSPTLDNALWFEEEYVRLNHHCLYDSNEDKLPTFEKMQVKWIPELIKNSHQRLTNNPKMNLPEGNTTPNLNPMIRYITTTSESRQQDNGYYQHIDDELSYYVNKGYNKNNYKKEVIEKYAIDDDHILNVFYMPVHPDSVASKSYSQHRAGIALGTSIKISGFFEDEEAKWWEYASMFNHEVAHIFGLKHAWTKYDGCEDTPVNPNCFSRSNTPPCNGVISNNLMDYNNDQRAITPCQLGIYHRTIHDIKSKQRKLVVERWCNYEPDNPIIITEPTHWIGNKDLSRDIIVESGARLTLSCRISMAESAKIIVKDGGHLILDNVRLHNDCGQLWGGIEVPKSIEKSISYRGTNIIENTPNIKS